MQNARDTFYVTLRDRLAAVNPARTMVLRGVESDLLLPETAKQMAARGPQATIVEIEGCGHAPALNVANQIKIVRDFLTA